MKKLYPIMLLAGVTAVSAQAQSKFDASALTVLNEYNNRLAYPGAKHIPSDVLPVNLDDVMSRAGSRAAVIVTMANGASPYELEAAGLEVVTDLGDMAVVAGSLDDIADLDSNDNVKVVSFGSKNFVKLDKSRTATGVDKIQAGTDIDKSYDGTGVITAIFDTGVDPNHVNFQDANGNNRISRLWHFRGNDGSSISYLSPERIATFTSDDTQETHGTHTMGCMAGSYNKRGGKVASVTSSGAVLVSAMTANPYYGMSTGSEIIVGCGQLYTPNIVTGLDKFVEYAESAGKPLVINLSIGSNAGPHDGTDSYAAALERVAEKAIVCCAAGNEGDENISFIKDFTASDNTFQTFWYENASTHQSTAQIWSGNSTAFDFTFFIYDRSEGKIVYEKAVPKGSDSPITIASSTYTNPSYLHDTTFDQAFSGSYVILTPSTNKNTNDRYSVEIYTNLTYNRTTNAQKNLIIGFKVTGSAGQHVDGACNSAVFTSLNVPGYSDGDSSMSISNIACGKHVISVGAWNVRNEWPCLGRSMLSYQDLTGMEINHIAGYSSYGTTIDGRSLPTICAPGTGIISSISKYYFDNVSASNSDYQYYMGAIQTANGRDNHWAAEQGTSMACPIVAGSIALWLQANPDLSVDEVFNTIKYTASHDYASADKARWGGGKFDAYAGIKHVLDPSGISSVVADSDQLLISRAGSDAWEVFAPNATSVDARLYNLSGVCVASASAASNTVTVSTQGLAKGVYVLNVNGNESRRLMVN